MPPDSPETTPSPPVDAAARETARQALDGALTVRTVRGEPTTHVNLALFGDALRHAGVPIEFRRGALSPLPPEPEEPPKTVGGATDRVSAVVEVPPVPFRKGDRVRTRAGTATDVPEALVGEVIRKVRCQGGVWLADVRWGDQGVSLGMDCGVLEHVDPRAENAFSQAVRYEFEAALSQSQRAARGEQRPAWFGTEPAEGTRRALIAAVLRAEDVLSETEIQEFASALELALNEADAAARNAELDAPHLEAERDELSMRIVGLKAELEGIGRALDSQGIPVAVNADRLTPVQRVEALVERCARQRVTIESLAPSPRDRPATGLVDAEVEKALNHLIFAMQAHREEGYPGTLQYGRSIRKAIIAVRQIKEPDLEGAGDPGPRDDENPNVWAAKSIAKSVDALSATVGGALRELLDRTATDRHP